MNCVSCDICVYHLGLFVFFPGVFLSSRVTGTCPVTTDLIMRVNVRTTTTTSTKKQENFDVINRAVRVCVVFTINRSFYATNDISTPRSTYD